VRCFHSVILFCHIATAKFSHGRQAWRLHDSCESLTASQMQQPHISFVGSADVHKIVTDNSLDCYRKM